MVPRPPVQVPPAQVLGTIASPTAATASGPNLDLASLHLFGQAQAPDAAPAQQPMQETALRLELRGAFASNEPSTARAIIADEQRRENSYRLDAPLPGGAVLKEIHSDHIVLSRNGRLETLRLPKERLESMSFDDAASGDFAAAAESSTQPELVASQGSLSELRDAVINDPQAMMGLLRAEPVNESGQITGYRLGPGQDPVMLRRFGLRHGDIVTAVNGVQLDGPTKLPELMRVLPSAQELRIEYKRRGQTRSVVLNLNE